MLLRLSLGNVLYVRTQGHELDRESPARHGFPGMQYLESIGILIVKSFLLHNGPDLLGRQLTRSLDQIVRHLRATVGETVKRVRRGVIGQVLFGK